MKRLLALLAAICCLVITASLAEAPWYSPIPVEAAVSQPLSATIYVRAEELPPLDDSRLSSLNSLIRHLSFTLSTAPSGEDKRLYGIQVSVDGTPAAALAGDQFPKSFLPAADTDWDLMMFPDLFLSDAEALIEAFPGYEGVTEKTERQTVRDGYGKTTRRLTIHFQTPDELLECIRLLCPKGLLSGFLLSVPFSGEQEVYLLCRDDGFTVKAAFTGTVLQADGTEKKIQFEWKRLRESDQAKDSISVSAPGKKNKTGLIEYKLIRKAERRGSSVQIELSDAQYTIAHEDGSQVQLRLDPCLLTRDDQNWRGELTLKTYTLTGKRAKLHRELSLKLDTQEGLPTVQWQLRDASASQRWSGTLTLLSGTDVRVPDIPEAIVSQQDTGMTPDAIYAEAARVFGQRVLARLILLDNPEDTAFLRDSLDDDAWAEVRRQAEAIINEQGGGE